MPSTRLVNGRLPENSPVTSTGRSWPAAAEVFAIPFDKSRPILLKNSIGAFPTTNLGVSNHHPIKLRRSERVSRGSMFSRVYDCGIAVEFFKCKGLPRPEATLESHGIECQD